VPDIVETEAVLGGKARLDGRRVSVFQIREMYTEADYAPRTSPTSSDCRSPPFTPHSPTTTTIRRRWRLFGNRASSSKPS